jgi:tryptophan-rich sensory protein
MKIRSLLLPLFALKLLLNFLWSLFFFNLHNPLLALIDILALWMLIFVLIAKTSKTSWSTAGLLIPYILWVSFATVLNIAILVLN